MIYCSIQNVLAIDLKGRKIEDQVNQIVSFYQGYLDLIKCYRKRFLLTEKNKELLTIKLKSAESKSFYGVTYPCKFGARCGPYTSR